MTCIIGLQTDNEVYIGGDSAATGGWEVSQTLIPKVFKTGEFIIGYTYSFRMGQLLMYKLKVPAQKDSIDDLRFIATVFVDAVKTCFKEDGFSTIKDNLEEHGGEFLVGYRNKLYRIQTDYSVLHNQDGLMAIGNGREYALGAMRAYENMPDIPDVRIDLSLTIAAYYSGSVIAPFTILKGTEEQGIDIKIITPTAEERRIVD